MSFNEILVQERKRRGLSQEDLAGMVNVSRQAVSKWETGDAMPDLPKLLALADALGISLDELCGRETRATSSTAPTASPKRRSVLLPLLCVILLPITAIALFLLLSMARPSLPPVTTDLSTMGKLTVSGLSFHGESNHAIAYRFTPSISGPGLTYQLIFTDSNENVFPIDISCVSGVCAGTAILPGIGGGYTVSLSVTDGVISRNLTLASGLNFSAGNASWNPVNS